MAMSPQAVAFGIEAVIRLGQAGKSAYEARILDQTIALPNIDVAQLDAPQRAVQIVSDAIMNGDLPGSWAEDHDLVAAGDISPAGLAAQGRIIAAATRLNADFAVTSELQAVAVLKQWHEDANRISPLGRIGLEVANLALDYVSANPALFGVRGNGQILVTSIATSLADLLPDPDDPNAPGTDFASGSIRIFAEAGLRALHQNVDKLIDEAHLQDLASSTLKPLIDAVAAGNSPGQPWYDLRDEFLGPVAEAAIDVLARHQVAFLGNKFDVDSKVGALSQSVLLAIKDEGLADYLGKEGVIKTYRAVLDTVVTRPELFFGDPRSDADRLKQHVLLNSITHLRANSPPFNPALGSALIATAFETVGANAPLLVRLADIDANDWTVPLSKISENLVEQVSLGLAEGLASGQRPDILSRVFNDEQAQHFLAIILEQVTRTPGMIADNTSPEVRLLVQCLARAIAEQKSILLSADDWQRIARSIAREVAENPGRLIKTNLPPDQEQLLFLLLSGALDAAAGDGGRGAGSVLFGNTLVQTIETLVQTAAGNAARALANEQAVKDLIIGLALFTRNNPDLVGRLEWLELFRHHIAGVMDSGELPEFNAAHLLGPVLEQ
jgi:rubredoxin